MLPLSSYCLYTEKKTLNWKPICRHNVYLSHLFISRQK